MKKSYWMVPVAVAAVVGAGAVWAATIGNLSGQACGDGYSGTWHFVNNQTGGAGAGTLSATWSTGDSCTVTASRVNASSQHFYCTASGTLLSAVTNLPGKLVLSDYSCSSKCDPDPKTGTCK